LFLGFIDSPDLRITWLENLSKFHYEHKNFEEAAQAKLYMCAFIISYLKLMDRLPPSLNSTDFDLVTPNLKKVLTLPKREQLMSVETDICQGKIFQ